jgi:SAM domain (Sterile alpha motif)
MWGAVMDVGGWLRSLGLGRYEANFRENRIDADLLPRLTDAGLKDIGVSALGGCSTQSPHWFAQNYLRTSLLPRQSLRRARAPKSRSSVDRSLSCSAI